MLSQVVACLETVLKAPAESFAVHGRAGVVAGPDAPDVQGAGTIAVKILSWSPAGPV